MVSRRIIRNALQLRQLFLGQGVGYSATQCSMLVSGLWGIFKFDEIKGRQMITGWFFSALTAVVGIVWLSLEHK